MNITIINKVKIVFYFTLMVNSCAFSQESTVFFNYYKDLNCSSDQYNSELVIKTIESKSDTIPITQFNSFIGDQKVYYFKNNEKKKAFGLGKLAQLPPTEIEDWSSNPPQIKYVRNAIYPICLEKTGVYTNIIYLYCSFETVSVSLLVVNNNSELISYLKLFEGNYNFLNNSLKYIKRTTVIKNGVFIQEASDDTPDQNKFVRTYKQRIDGYFELME